MTDPEAIANAHRINPQLTNVEERATAGTASTRPRGAPRGGSTTAWVAP